MCTVLLPLGVNPIAVNEYIISYISYLIYSIRMVAKEIYSLEPGIVYEERLYIVLP
jgi:hypothetical protein